MKIAVSSLLLLVTLVECRFGSSNYGSFSIRKKKYIQPRPGVCLSLIWENFDAYDWCQKIASSYVTCEFVASLLPQEIEYINIGIRQVLNDACRDTPTTAGTTTTTTTPRPTTTKKPGDPDADPCGHSPSLRLREPIMRHGGRGRIVGGEYINDCAMVPWQVYVQAGHFMCGGSILTRKHILTAAHCFTKIGYNAAVVKVWVGTHSLVENGDYGSSYEVDTLRVHELYNSKTDVNDIAILTLKENMNYSKCVHPICLEKSFVPRGHKCIVAGWGRIVFNGTSPDKLKMTKVKTYQGDVCNATFDIKSYNYVRNGSSQLCAGYINGGTDSCQGDSGGPLVCWHGGRYVQTGIVSYGRECARPNLPGIYTSVAYFDEWIRKYVPMKKKRPALPIHPIRPIRPVRPTRRPYFDWSKTGF